jgi:hypothetical protein
MDIMKRALVLLLLILPLVALPARAAGERAVTVWDGDRVITSPVEVLPDDMLEIEAGANITFDAENATGGGAGEDTPSLYIEGRFDVCGTAQRPVRFNSTPGLWETFGAPECIFIQGDDKSDLLSVSNASFTDLVLGILNGSGEFRDCLFDRCEVDIHFSAVRFINCTFVFSWLRNGQTYIGRGGPQPDIRGCRFSSYGSASHPPIWKYGEDYNKDAEYFGETAIEDWGGAMIEDCTVTGYSLGMATGPGNASISGCDISHCMDGMTLWSDYPEDIVTVRGCTVTGCAQTGMMISESILLSNCTVSGCNYGVWLYSYGNATSIIEGNRIYNNSMMGMLIYGKDSDLSGNYFGNGSDANGAGILSKMNYMRVRVLDSLGSRVQCRLYWNDSQGHGDEAATGGDQLIQAAEYSIDNSGDRTDYFPYTFHAELAARTNQTTVQAWTYNITLVLSVLADIAPLNLSIQPEMPAAGENSAFSVRLENSGYYTASRGSVSYILDGKEFDRQQIPPLKGGLTETVYSKDWKAKAGRHALRVVLDPEGNISESDRTNNVMSLNFTVEQAPPAGFTDRAAPWLQVALIILVTVVILGGSFRRRKGIRKAEGQQGRRAARDERGQQGRRAEWQQGTD